MGFKISDRVTWVGKIDWELRKFHGDEYSTNKGSSYNSYLIRDKKIALIDTVWKPFDEEFIDELKKEIDLADIDYIISNHSEVDHSGALPLLMEQIPDTPIYCTANGEKTLRAHYQRDWNFKVVKTGDTLSLGDTTLHFVEARMLHWPDSMFTYMDTEDILFSNDAFGQHYASEEMYNDLVDQCDLEYEALKYFANILTPFRRLVIAKINEILGMELNINMICPSHGIIWRDNPVQIVERYLKWSDDYKEDQITVIYDSMWGATRTMADYIAKGVKKHNPDTIVKVFNSAKHDKNEIVSEVFKSKAVLVGSSTINKGILYSSAGILEMIKGLALKGKKASAFGSYGWSGESVKIILKELGESGFEVINDGLRLLWKPDAEGLKKCIRLGEEIGR